MSDSLKKQPLYIMMLSLHGLIRGHDLELGRDADTGGQITYVIELAQALGRSPDIDRVDLVTRLVEDPSISKDYAQPEESLGSKGRIIRLPFGPRRYLQKELFWSHLDLMVDKCLNWMREQDRLPDLIHSHYADAGYVGLQLSKLLGIPLAHTGHSLGRCKKARLMAAGRKEQALDKQFNFPKRIEAEEAVLAGASILVTSTRQEANDQYGLYDNFRPKIAAVIPPGIDLSRFSPPPRAFTAHHVQAMVDRFLQDHEKPIILTICRPDARKNLHRLITAYGTSKQLQDMSNLVIIAGNRDNVLKMGEDEQAVLSNLLFSIDEHDLYGRVAIPKHHTNDDIPELYRLAAKRRGVFVNPALTEPFGLTLIEAAASGLPIIATEDGGPTDIIANCQNGLLVNPMDPDDIARTLLMALSNRAQWKKWSKNGINGVKRHYSWDAHVKKYLKQLYHTLRRERKQIRRNSLLFQHQGESAPPFNQHVLVSDIDNTLLGDRKSLSSLVEWIRQQSRAMAFGIATGRSLDSALQTLKEWKVPTPDLLITSVGSEIHYGNTLQPDLSWNHHIRFKWRRCAIEEALQGLSGLRPQPEANQREFKLSYYMNHNEPGLIEEIKKILKNLNLHANLIHSHGEFLDILPVRASKGQAIRYLAYKWGLPLQNFLVSGDSGNDTEMLIGDTLGIVVGNYSPELHRLKGQTQIYFARHHYAAGILEGLAHYGFIDTDKYPSLLEYTHD
ncbi:MAG: HAD-IIB family hydrolase [Proteobacteria bacterium]|nr:HAD-IIB family hydrolase [Pseudomonadota bacterium]MDE3207571.1 HAD-IIB family hydrolase [Pseudomonadota bacterium]